jgi:hypothetical protein
MFLLSRRQAHAALAGCAAAAAYYAAAEIGSKRPVRFGALFLLTSATLAGVMTQGLSNRASAKAASVESRLNQFFNSGGQVGGNLVVNGNHTINGNGTVTGNHTVNGQSVLNNATMSGNIAMNNNNIDGCLEMNTGGGKWDNHAGQAGFWGPLFMNGNPIHP